MKCIKISHLNQGNQVQKYVAKNMVQETASFFKGQRHTFKRTVHSIFLTIEQMSVYHLKPYGKSMYACLIVARFDTCKTISKGVIIQLMPATNTP